MKKVFIGLFVIAVVSLFIECADQDATEGAEQTTAESTEPQNAWLKSAMAWIEQELAAGRIKKEVGAALSAVTNAIVDAAWKYQDAANATLDTTLSEGQAVREETAREQERVERTAEERTALSSDSTSEEHAGFSENTKRLLALYQELYLFKDDPEFHQVGFGVCCRFNDWQKRVVELSSRTKLETLYDVGMTPGDLSVLGSEYLTSKGQPTNYSLVFEPQWEAGIARLELQR